MNFTDSHRLIKARRYLWRLPGPTPCSEPGLPEQVFQGCVQLGFDYLQGWRWLLQDFLLLKINSVLAAGCCKCYCEELTVPRYCRLNSGDKLEDEQFCLGATHTDSQDLCSFVPCQKLYPVSFCGDVTSQAAGISLKGERTTRGNDPTLFFFPLWSTNLVLANYTVPDLVLCGHIVSHIGYLI